MTKWLKFNIYLFLSLAFLSIGLGLILSNIKTNELKESNSSYLLAKKTQHWIQQIELALSLQNNLSSDKNTNIKKFNELVLQNNQLIVEIYNSTKTNLKKEQIVLFNKANELNKEIFEGISENLSRNNSKKINAENSNFSQKLYEIKKVVLSLEEQLTKQQNSSRNNELIYLFFSLSLICFVLEMLRLKKESQQQQIENQTLMQSFKNMSEAVVISDQYGYFKYKNDAAEKMFGSVVNDVVYESSLEHLGFFNLQQQPVPKKENPIYLGLKKIATTEQEFLIKNIKNQNFVFVKCSVTPFFNKRLQVTGTVCVLKNISQEKQIEQFWKQESENAQKKNEAQADFLASMSHEIRTPMNGILGLSTLLQKTNQTDLQSQYTKAILRSARSLVTLMNDILDQSKIENGQFSLNMQIFKLDDLLNDIQLFYEPLFQEKNLKLIIDADNLKNCLLLSDASRLRQIIFNLLSNALKFTTAGHVKLSLSREVDRLKVSIKDQGCGMNEIELENLFKKYFQTQQGKRAGGTGLGLHICKQLVDAFNGQIKVNSKPNDGTEFIFEIPVDFNQSQHLIESNNLSTQFLNSKFSQNDFKVLIAEDNKLNQLVLKEYLAELNLTCEIASNGQEAFEKVQSIEFDIIFMDTNMPLLNGPECTQKIRAFELSQSRKSAFIIGLSADARESNYLKNKNSGMNSFLTKPLEFSSLVTELKKVKLEQNHNNLIDQLTLNCVEPLIYPQNSKTQSSNHFIHLEKIKHLKMGTQLLIEVLLNEFKNQIQIFKLESHKLIESRQSETLYQFCHTLKSSCYELDLVETAHSFEDLEIICETENLFSIKKNIDTLNLKLHETFNTYNEEVLKTEAYLNTILAEQAKNSSDEGAA